jgi:hypothetical protein
MKQILLAIDGEVPSPPVFQYATDLCRQIRANLCILQFASENRDKREVFAASIPLKKMLETPGCPVPVSVSSSAGNLEKDLSAYVDTHHDVILTVYDPSQDRRQKAARRGRRIDGLKKSLGVPVVVMKRQIRERP